MSRPLALAGWSREVGRGVQFLPRRWAQASALQSGFATGRLAAAASAKELACQEITVPLCRGVGYNYTYMPNQFNHDTQDEAGLEVHQFWPLVEIQCSTDLKFFLCSMYTPICLEDYKKPLPPCRAVCERAKAGCPGCQCRAPMVSVSSERHPLYNRVRTGQIANCALPCHNPFFSQDERAFTVFWIGLWSVLCFVSTFATVSTFLIDMERFKYPERPIIFLSACYLFVSVGYLVRLVAGHEKVACSGGGAGALACGRCSAGRLPGTPGGGTREGGLQRRGRGGATTGPALCTVVFLLVYFFGMASSIWWVILSLTWFLAAGMKWGNEAIAGYSQYFHLAAWLVPSVKSIAVLALSSVDGDPVAGICYVGNQSLDNLRGFVLAPLVIYLFIGTMFLLAGFVSLFRIRSVIKQQGGPTKTHKLEKLMIRLGLFTVLY
ncbi:frizzled-8, partial [Fukomys damarensis]|uniref:frizzled-8 n=1 Tax=Fukomys damarensis TaxID=885580 RepID=UPI0008FF4981